MTPFVLGLAVGVLAFDLGFVAGAWWATRKSLPPRALRSLTYLVRPPIADETNPNILEFRSRVDRGEWGNPATPPKKA